MGKASKWFSKLLGGQRRKSLSSSDADALPLVVVSSDPNKHAIAVAVATAAAAEAALAAAKAAAEVVRLTSNAPPTGHVSNSRRCSFEDVAAVKIQSAFRGYLARKALRALKGVVKLQALWRGHFVRKQSADMLRRLQALVRVQHRAVANRAHNLESTHSSRENSTRYEIHATSARTEDLSALKRIGSITSIKESNWLENWVEDGSSMNSPRAFKVSDPNYDEKSDKILEMDSWKPNSRPRSRSQNYLRSSQQHITVQDYYNRSFAASDYLARYAPNHLLDKPSNNNIAEDVASLKSLHYFPLEASESARRSPKTPLRDHEGSRSFLSGSPSPSFMANTQSSRAKARSQSVPRQRGGDQLEKRSPSCKKSLHVLWELRTSLRRKSDSFF